MKKIIIDTDPGHDDALAIMLMVKSGLFDIKALTTVAGNSTIENVTRNATCILNLLENQTIPIYSGKKNPLKRELVQAVVHGKSGLDGIDTNKTRYTITNNAPEKIIEIVRANPGKMTILALGPLSNIARALIKDPKLPLLIREIVIMGGAINVPGNKNRVAEFNMFVDPDAADIVLRAEVKKVLIPIDICNDTPLFLRDFNKLKGTKLYNPIISMMKQFIRGISKYEGTKGALVYDAIAGYYLVNPEAFRLEAMDILIETLGEYTFGMTVVEKRKSEKKKYNINVAIEIERNKFTEDFIKILKK